jgi:endonuclease/exonuclease/phosphatase family metal-dependent hydrolase
VTRDPELIAECQDLVATLRAYPTLSALRAAPAWPELERRLTTVLGTVRRHAPAHPPAAAPSDRVRAVHWNVEHGNWYEQVERALREHPQLTGADLVLCNEIDFGMARAGNRDVTGDLATALGMYAAWAPLFIETTVGRDDDPATAAGRENQESLFGLAILSRWPLGATRVLELPSPTEIQFDLERMYGRHIALIAEVLRPEQPFVAVSVHLEVHRTRARRADQMRLLMSDLKRETRPILLAGDFNSHTFDRGRRWDPLMGAVILMAYPSGVLERRFLYPDRGRARETLFDALRDGNFEWQRFVDRYPTLNIRFSRLDEARGVLSLLGPLADRLLGWAEKRGRLRLDWFAGRGWRDGRGATVRGLNGPGQASDHAPIVAEFR